MDKEVTERHLLKIFFFFVFPPFFCFFVFSFLLFIVFFVFCFFEG